MTDKISPRLGMRGAVIHLVYIEADFDSFRRGGSSREAVCVCGWRGPQRGTLELVVDDALEHERESRALESA